MKKFFELCLKIEMATMRLVALALFLMAVGMVLYAGWHHLLGMLR